MRTPFAHTLAALAALLLVSCVLTTSFDAYDTTPPGRLFGVSGTVEGLDVGSVSLLLNGASPITVGNGPFKFPPSLVDGATWDVTLASTPPESTCDVTNNTGLVAGSDIEGVTIRCLPTDASLADLVVSVGPLSPTFASGTHAYSAVWRSHLLVSAPAVTTVTATALRPNATIAINGVGVASGAPSDPIALKPGPNPIDVTVTAPDGFTQSTYAVVVSGVVNDYIKASNTRADANFGAAIALDGNTLVVGSPGESSAATGIGGNASDTSAPSAGAVYVFTGNAGTWTQQAYIKASNTRAVAWFGSSVALSGDTLAVGSPLESSNAVGIGGDQSNTTASQAGAVYVFQRSGTTWAQQAYVKASNTHSGNHFGTAVALGGDTLAVGSEGESSCGLGVESGNQTWSASCGGSGAVYVFTRSGVVWSQQAHIKSSNDHVGAIPYAFGCSVSLSGESLAVGSFGEASNATGVNGDESDRSATGSGAAYVFVRANSIWTQQAYVKASNTGGHFGTTVALAVDTLVVGAINEQSNATGIDGDQSDISMGSAGAVYVFARSSTTWTQQAYVKASNTRPNAAFGTGLALSGDTLAVGAYDTSNATGINGDQSDAQAFLAGAVYLFQRSGVTWTQQAFVKASNTIEYSQFLFPALTGSLLAVGAIGEPSNATGIGGDQTNTSAPNSGAVYVY